MYSLNISKMIIQYFIFKTFKNSNLWNVDSITSFPDDAIHILKSSDTSKMSKITMLVLQTLIGSYRIKNLDLILAIKRIFCCLVKSYTFSILKKFHQILKLFKKFWKLWLKCTTKRLTIEMLKSLSLRPKSEYNEKHNCYFK